MSEALGQEALSEKAKEQFFLKISQTYARLLLANKRSGTMTATTTLSREFKLAIFAGCMISFISFGFSASFSVFL